jgi:hypothetical protein
LRLRATLALSEICWHRYVSAGKRLATNFLPFQSASE